MLGRELFTPDEVRKLDNKKCIIFIRGFDPIIDQKYIPFGHPAFHQTADGKGKAYVHEIVQNINTIGKPFELLSPKALKRYEHMRDEGKPVYIDAIKMEELSVLSELDVSRRFSSIVEKRQKEMRDAEQGNELEYTADIPDEYIYTDSDSDDGGALVTTKGNKK